MSQFLDRLNLRPQERRLAVGVAAVLFIVLNLWLVWPHHRDWERLGKSLTAARASLVEYRTEIGRIPEYQAKLEKLERQGSAVLPSEQALQLQRVVMEQANRSGLVISRYDPAARGQESSTNAFFEEKSLVITIPQTGNAELVDFLYNLGSGNSMIRVRDLELKQTPAQTRLQCRATLIASYQKTKPLELKTAPGISNRLAVTRKP